MISLMTAQRARFQRVSVCLFAAVVQGGQDGWTVTHVSRVPGAQELRGYGRVATEFAEMAGPDGARAWVLRFRCANRAKAATVVGKYLADLGLSHGGQSRQPQPDLPRRVLPAHESPTRSSKSDDRHRS